MDDDLKAILLIIKNELQQAHSARAAHVEKSLPRLKEVRAAHVRGEPAVRARIDADCLYWIEHGKWQAVQQVQDAVYIWERLNSGYLFGAWLYSCGFRSLPAQRKAILKFLLVSQWEVCGSRLDGWRNPQGLGAGD